MCCKTFFRSKNPQGGRSRLVLSARKLSYMLPISPKQPAFFYPSFRFHNTTDFQRKTEGFQNSMNLSSKPSSIHKEIFSEMFFIFSDLFFPVIEHSQTIPTRQPSSKSCFISALSLSLLRFILFCQNSVFVLGITKYLHPSCPCQKHPFTKMTVL